MLNKEDLKDKKGYVIVTEYFHQYALGITGINRYNKIITNKGLPFRFKKDAQEFIKSKGINSYRKKGEKNVGYGSLNAESLDVYIIKTSEIGDKYRYYTIVNE